MIERDKLVKQLGRVAVFYGGTSAERAVSLESGRAVVSALECSGVTTIPVEVNEGTLATFDASCCDRVFIALHGRGGEDGTLQGFLECVGMPYTGSGVLASALAMDKMLTKQIWLAQGLPTPPFIDVDKASPDHIFDALGPLICIKPAHEGSSIGVEQVDSVEALGAAVSRARQHDQRILAERWVTGDEYTVAIVAGEVLPVIGLSTENQFYDYEAKYLSDKTRYQLPCGLSREEERAMQALARDAFSAIGCRGWGRVDIMRDAQGQSWLLEVNTVPGMTSHSLVPMAARAFGWSFEALVLRILAETLPESGQ